MSDALQGGGDAAGFGPGQAPPASGRACGAMGPVQRNAQQQAAGDGYAMRRRWMRMAAQHRRAGDAAAAAEGENGGVTLGGTEQQPAPAPSPTVACSTLMP